MAHHAGDLALLYFLIVADLDCGGHFVRILPHESDLGAVQLLDCGGHLVRILQLYPREASPSILAKLHGRHATIERKD